MNVTGSLLRVLALAGVILLASGGMSWAQFTGTNIATCGTITTPGEYLIGPPFDPSNPVSTVTHSGTGDCIRIKAPNVTIWFYNGDPSYLLGDGQGTAI